MKKDEIYPYYIDYLNDRLSEGKISKGSFSLLKMSNTSFEDFKYRFENDELFHDAILNDSAKYRDFLKFCIFLKPIS